MGLFIDPPWGLDYTMKSDRGRNRKRKHGALLPGSSFLRGVLRRNRMRMYGNHENALDEPGPGDEAGDF